MSSINHERRRGDRTRLPMDVRCRVAPGKSPEVWLTEISVTGCQLRIRASLLVPQQFVVIKPPDIEGLPGTVKWVHGEAAGVQFEQPLHEAVLRHLLYGPPQFVPSRKHDFVDRFGRRLPSQREDRHLPSNRRSCL